jgi:hypothetical protein
VPTDIQLAWSKLNKYYEYLDNSPVYVAAVVLHPQFKWKWFKKAWKERQEWIAQARIAFNSLQVEYGTLPLINCNQAPPPSRQEPPSSGLDSDEDDEVVANIDQQFTEYLRDSSGRQQVNTPEKSPLGYWLAKQSIWPHLAAMALDIYSIPVMSDEPERVFSITGAAVNPRRRLLESQKIGQLMCLKAWSQSNIVQFDR